MSGSRLFIILENPKERMALVELFEGMGFKLDAVPSGEGALAYLSDAEAACKRTGAPTVVLCRQAILAAVHVVGRGRPGRRRGTGSGR